MAFVWPPLPAGQQQQHHARLHLARQAATITPKQTRLVVTMSTHPQDEMLLTMWERLLVRSRRPGSISTRRWDGG